jgi:RNA polymerase sigma-70 factor (ECF subfamily)
MSNPFKNRILLAKLKAKDDQAFIEAYDLYVDKIYRFVFYKVSSAEDAQDLTSAVFLKAWDHIRENSLTDHKTLPALFYKIARNTVIDHYRKTAKEQANVALSDPENDIDLPDENQDPAARFALASDLAAVNEKLAELKDEYREAIILRYMDELSISEIAEILDKSKGNVRILIFRALKALRELLEKE